MLRKLCSAIDLRFDPAMLSWAAGPRAEDGIWAAHWYGAVHKSAGFAGAEGPLLRSPVSRKTLCAQAMPHYQKLYDQRLR